MVDEYSGSALALAPPQRRPKKRPFAGAFPYDLLKQTFIHAFVAKNGANARALFVPRECAQCAQRRQRHENPATCILVNA